MLRATFIILKYALIESCCFSRISPSRAAHVPSRRQKRRICAVLISELVSISSAAKRRFCICRASRTLAAIALLASARPRRRISSDGTGLTRTCMSILSMMGPESLER